MVLVDTSIWILHLKSANHDLIDLLREARVVTHPFVIGELACGSLSRRGYFLELLSLLPQAKEASNQEVLGFIDEKKLYSQGIGWIDAHLLASARLSNITIFTTDKSLAKIADKLDILYHP